MLMNRHSSVQYAATDYEAIIMEEKLYTQTEVDAIIDKAWDDGYDVGYSDGRIEEREGGRYDSEDEVD